VRPPLPFAIAACIATIATCVATSAATHPRLDTVAVLEHAPGNVTLTPEGRVILSLHPMFEPDLRVVELQADGSLAPFPDAEWNRGQGDPLTRLDAVLGVRSDAAGVVWMLDTGLRTGVTPKLVGWDSRAGALRAVIPLPPPATVAGSFVNDLAVDGDAGVAYIADPARGSDAALVVVRLDSGQAWRVLQGHASVVPEDVELVVDGAAVRATRPDGGSAPVRVGADSIALSHDGAWLYYGPLSGTTLYRVPTAALRDRGLDGARLGARVQRFAAKPVSDGIALDAAGNVYVTDVGHHAVGVITASGDWGRLVQDPVRLSWPDALAFGPDGLLYAVSNQLHLSPAFQRGRDASSGRYHVVRFRPLAPGAVGR